MTPILILGDPAYSSWSMRPWLVVDRFRLPHETRWVPLYTEGFADRIGHPPARTVPVLVVSRDIVARDSLAIVETLAGIHPDAPIWPVSAETRAEARSLAAEMHSGFAALRAACPMNLRMSDAAFAMPDAVRADLARIEALWDTALDRFGGPWLCGEWSAADAFFAPVAARIATYRLPVGGPAGEYVARQLADPGFRRWRALGLTRGPDLHPAHYPAPLQPRPWPGPAPRRARPAEGPSVNASCPYSGAPATHFLELGGRVWGFGNAACRDKTMADPEVWPAFEAMRRNFNASESRSA